MLFKFFFETFLFLFFVISCFYLPAVFFINKLKLSLNLSPLEKTVFSIPFGIVIFTFISYVFDSLRIFYLIIPLIIFLDIFAIRSIKNLKELIPKVKKSEVYIFSFLLIFSLIFSITMLLSGKFGNNLSLAGMNGRDSLWHLALINELRNHFPPDNPGFSNIPLSGYHFFFNFLIAKVSLIVPISIFSLYFQFFPLLFALLWSFGVYILVEHWIKKRIVSLLAVFFSLFAGSFGYVAFLLGFKINLDSGFGILQPFTSLVNPPFTISILIIIFGLFSLLCYLESDNKGWIIPIILFFGQASEFKIYAGIIMLFGFSILCIRKMFQRKFQYIFLGLLILGVFLLTYWRFTGSSGYLVFYPFWAPHDVFKSNFPSLGYEQRILAYSQNSNFLKTFILESLIFIIYLIGNLGTRIIGIILLGYYLFRGRIRYSDFNLTIFTMFLISFLIPMFYIQSIKAFEITQMFNYFLFFSAIFSAIGFGLFLTSKIQRFFKILFFSILILFTIPSAFFQFKEYAYLPIPKSDAKAALFIKDKSNYNATVLELPPKTTKLTKQDLREWYNRESTPEILVLSDKRGYLNNQYIDFPGIDIDLRIDFLYQFLTFNLLDKNSPSYIKMQKEIKEELKERGIVYIYSQYSLNNSSILENVYKDNETNYVYKLKN